MCVFKEPAHTGNRAFVSACYTLLASSYKSAMEMLLDVKRMVECAALKGNECVHVCGSGVGEI